MSMTRVGCGFVGLLLSFSAAALEYPSHTPLEVRASFSCVFSQSATNSQKSILSFNAVLGVAGKMRRVVETNSNGFAAYLPAQAVDSLLTNNLAIAQCERSGLV